MSFPYADIELNILQRWKINKTFEKQQERTRNNKLFSLKNRVLKTQVIKRLCLFISSLTLMVPLFATGLPHYGHIVASILKDVFPRYKSMMGYYVPRRWCWDVHGLPILNIK